MNAEQNLKVQAKKRALNTFIYYICMLLCYFPAAVSALIWVTYKEHWNNRWYFTDTITFMNSAINPFLYFWRNREIREAVSKIVRKRKDQEELQILRADCSSIAYSGADNAAKKVARKWKKQTKN
ncbi:unnamed protein product [Porites evermanni]|uniref:G-protein coupled receptors family 1 profile domain-containing protein n=1 Tax=Porites evermanni TaxID=104178 RepID=A0ABN8SQJ2_9CNID|nr:unnamed protein product [Porites evermanni]